MKRSVITVSLVIDHDETEDPIVVLEEALRADHEGRIGEVIEPHVDSTEDVKEEP